MPKSVKRINRTLQGKKLPRPREATTKHRFGDLTLLCSEGLDSIRVFEIKTMFWSATSCFGTRTKRENPMKKALKKYKQMYCERMYEQDKPLFPLQFGRHGTSSDWCGTTSTPAVKSAPRKEVHIHRKIHVHDLNGSELMLYKGPHGSLCHQHCIKFAGCRCLSIVEIE